MPVQVVEYDPAWPEKFREQREVLGPLIGRWLHDPVEHVGSTAVPGLAAKPIIDIAAPVVSLREARAALSVLERGGWCFWPDDPNRWWRLWLLRPRPQARTHHLYLIEHDDPHLLELRAFRDRLRADSALRSQYAELKVILAQKYRGDRDAYTAAKSEFVRGVLAGCGLQIQPRTASE
jgi:GrpB-like predicted nucleotidyltransferase (UPF0157 family)